MRPVAVDIHSFKSYMIIVRTYYNRLNTLVQDSFSPHYLSRYRDNFRVSHTLTENTDFVEWFKNSQNIFRDILHNMTSRFKSRISHKYILYNILKVYIVVLYECIYLA